MAELLSRKNVKIFRFIFKTLVISTGSLQATADFLPACIFDLRVQLFLLSWLTTKNQ